MSSDPRPAKRPFLSSTECAICFEAYNLETHIPVMGTCGHSICATCRTFLPKKCPICQEANAFVREVKNFSLIQLIEERLSAEERQKVDCGCHLCQRPVDDADFHVCLECVQKKDCRSFEDLMIEMDSFKMCNQCAEAIQKHGGHDTHKLSDAKGSLYTMNLKLDMEFIANLRASQLDSFHNACGIANEAYKQFDETCMKNGRMIGSQSEFKTFRDSIFENVVRLHTTLSSSTSSVWKFTNDCLETTEAIAKEKEKLQEHEFTTAEDSTFRAVLATTRRNPTMRLQKPKVTTEDWKRMTHEEKKAKALEMLQESGGGERNEGETGTENGR